MNKRQKDLKVMAEDAGLVALHPVRRHNRVAFLCEAPNGVTQEFTISNGSSMDQHGDLNERARMKRFARENPAPAAAPQPPQQQKAPSMPARTPAPMAEQLAAVNIAATQVLDLSPVEFLRLSLWLSNQQLAQLPSMDALVMHAGQHLGKPVEEGTVRNAMKEMALSDPEHWGEPTDPQAIIVREIGLLLEGLGQKPTPAFKKLAGLFSK